MMPKFWQRVDDTTSKEGNKEESDDIIKDDFARIGMETRWKDDIM